MRSAEVARAWALGVAAREILMDVGSTPTVSGDGAPRRPWLGPPSPGAKVGFRTEVQMQHPGWVDLALGKAGLSVLAWTLRLLKSLACSQECTAAFQANNTR